MIFLMEQCEVLSGKHGSWLHRRQHLKAEHFGAQRSPWVWIITENWVCSVYKRKLFFTFLPQENMINNTFVIDT